MRKYTTLDEEEQQYILENFDAEIDADDNLVVRLKCSEPDYVVIGKLTNGSYIVGAEGDIMRIYDESHFKEKPAPKPPSPICPRCKDEIDYVVEYYIERKTVDLYSDGSTINDDTIDGEDIDYCCPKCGCQITISYSSAIAFLNMEDNWDNWDG